MLTQTLATANTIADTTTDSPADTGVVDTAPARANAPLSASQIDEVRRTWALVHPIRHVAADLFYQRLFYLHPALRRLFKGDLSLQGTMLMAALGGVVANLDRLDKVNAAVAPLARRHVDYGVRPEHYDQVGEVLLWTLATALQSHFTATAQAGWTSAYGHVATAMKAAAYPKAANIG